MGRKTDKATTFKSPKLQHLNLQSNNFIGIIPLSIGNLTQLASLILAENEFDGPIPSSLGNFSQLLKLNLSYNNFHGHMPKEVFSITTMTSCVLAYNDLDGPIPLDFAELQQLTKLHLSSNRLTGKIPESLGQCHELENIQMDQNLLTGNIPISFSSLKSLAMLNLSHNNLSSTIPTALGELKFLNQLDLSYNNLNGEVPTNGVFENTTAVSIIGNWGICGGPSNLQMPPCPTTYPRKGMLYYLVRILIPLLGFMSVIPLLYLTQVKNKTSKGTYLLLLSFGKQFPKVSYHDLARATGDFSKSNLIGSGSYGSVYEGKLVQVKVQVAIKVFDLKMRCADKSYISKCEVLRSIRHRNLLPILTACSTIDNLGNDFKALVYEFMPNGNLDKWLHKKSSYEAPNSLGLGQRISITANIADALSYLHHDSRTSIVHCDLKPSNILLDADMNAYLGDFGISNLVHNSTSTSACHSGVDSSLNSSIGLWGTIGYIAPGLVISTS